MLFIELLAGEFLPVAPDDFLSNTGLAVAVLVTVPFLLIYPISLAAVGLGLYGWRDYRLVLLALVLIAYILGLGPSGSLLVDVTVTFVLMLIPLWWFLGPEKAISRIRPWVHAARHRWHVNVSTTPSNDPAIIARHSRLSDNVGAALISVIASCFFFIVTLLGLPDRELVVTDARVALPFAGLTVSATGLLVLGPLIVIVLTSYLHLFLAEWTRLRNVPYEARSPHLFNLPLQTATATSYLLFYWLTPATLMFFSWKALPRREGPFLVCTTCIVAVTLLWLQSRRCEPSKGSVTNVCRGLLIIGLLPLAYLSGSTAVIQPFFADRVEMNAEGSVSLESVSGIRLGYVGVMARTARYRWMWRALELSGADLRARDLHGISLHGANLTNAQLQGANLSTSDLTNTRLVKADLSRSNMYLVNLTGADLTGAVLSGVKVGIDESERFFDPSLARRLTGLTAEQVGKACTYDDTVLPNWLPRPPLNADCPAQTASVSSDRR